MGQMVELKGNGKKYRGYLAPSVTGAGPGVIVIQEYWGLVDHIKNVVDRFAKEGFTAMAPDFYDGKATTEPDEAGKLMMSLNISDAGKVINGAVEKLLSHAGTKGDKVGGVGFCMGGQLALYAASINPRIGACVDYYGIHPNVRPRFENLKAPVLGFFAEEDTYASPEDVKALSETLKKLGKKHEFITFPGTHHAFFNDDRPEVYDKKAAEDSWRRMTAFFRENL
jgi:carboxymethylenebutenolidase